MKYFGFVVCCALIVLAFSPVAAYYWGLSRLDHMPEAPATYLSEELEHEIWSKYYSTPDRLLTRLTPYDVLLHMNCLQKNLQQKSACEAKYPGMSIAAYVAQMKVLEQRDLLSSNTEWLFATAAVTIWITRNWSIEQVLASYGEIHGV